MPATEAARPDDALFDPQLELHVLSHDDACDSSPQADVVSGNAPTPHSVPCGSTGTASSPETREQARPNIDRLAFWSLAAQHLSSTWGDRTAEFAFYLYLIELFRITLLPASLYGFFTTGSAILLSGSMGSLVAGISKLRLVRICIVTQKLSALAAYACFIPLFSTGSLLTQASRGRDAGAPVWALFTAITLVGCSLKLSTVGIQVAVERDWVTTIAEGDDARLTQLNTMLRRIDLLSKLAAPLFVSLLTTTASYTFSVAFLAGLSVVSMCFEFIWIEIVYRRLPALREVERARTPNANEPSTSARHNGRRKWSARSSLAQARNALRAGSDDWATFVKNPLFPSSLAISLLYLTTLSFDGTLISYLKAHAYQDAFVAGMRGLCVLTGLFGTVIMPIMEKHLGLVRAGSWAIWAELISLIPVTVSFFVGAPNSGERSSAWNAALLFGGMAASRIWLWAFDLCQLKELQTALADHPRRNQLTALQFSLQNIADLLKYVLTIVLSRPEQFRWAALASAVSVFSGAVSYTVFVRRMRGHLVHLEWMAAIPLLGKKNS